MKLVTKITKLASKAKEYGRCNWTRPTRNRKLLLYNSYF